jgi:hypothetical protein
MECLKISFNTIYCFKMGGLETPVSLSPTEKSPDGQPKPIFRQRVVMPLEGFMHSLGMLEKAKQKLIEDGRLRRTDAAPRPPASGNFP